MKCHEGQVSPKDRNTMYTETTQKSNLPHSSKSLLSRDSQPLRTTGCSEHGLTVLYNATDQLAHRSEALRNETSFAHPIS